MGAPPILPATYHNLAIAFLKTFSPASSNAKLRLRASANDAICAGIGYSLEGVPSQRDLRVRVYSILACVWAAGAQVWYYAQFRSLWGAFSRAFLHMHK